MKANAIPTIFNDTKQTNEDRVCISEGSETFEVVHATHATCTNCCDLEAEIIRLKAANVQTDLLKKNIEELKNKYEERGDKLCSVRKELRNEKLEVQRLQALVSELKTNRYISPKLADAVNVNYYMEHFIYLLV